jgi:ferrous iron transport protein B
MTETTASTAVRHIAIAGNPNCGKSTLFNALTGLRQKIGNYPGVTVERKVGYFRGTHGESMTLLDLPGSYSMQVRSPDEAVARDVLLGKRTDTPRPDAVICVLDASNLERNLYLLAQILELRLPVVVALNMVDVAEANGHRIDVAALSRALRVPVIPMVATTGRGIVELKAALSAPTPLACGLTAPMDPLIQNQIHALAGELGDSGDKGLAEASLWISQPSLDDLPAPTRIAVQQAQGRIQSGGVDPFSAPVEARYAWIHEICADAIHGDGRDSATVSDRLDAILTHRWWGWVAFVSMMAIVFFSIFTVASYPMEWIDSGFSALADLARTVLPDGDFRSLVADGVIAGVGGVVIFLPQILVLFFFLGLLEDSGYMARAAFIMDRVMSRVGLHGKSFIPLLSSFACAIPGIMATRTIENRKDRLVTILVAPLMSCSARLPVYALMIAVLLPTGSVWEKAGILLAMYALGTVTAFGMAWLFKKTLLRGETPMLLLELPPYRMPSVLTVTIRMLERAKIFLVRAGTVIFALSILLWALATYPKSAVGTDAAVALANSFAGRMGHAIEPLIEPLGYDWKIGIGLIASFAAREVFVATMGIVYNLQDVDETSQSLIETIRNQVTSDGLPVFTPLVCVGLMVFYVLAMQCISTVAIVRRETNSWRWPLFQIAYMTALAYAGAFIVYQGGRLLGFQ